MKRGKSLRMAALTAGLALVVAACSSTGGKKAAQSTEQAAASAGKANTPHLTIAMITHQQPGDTFWDIIRKGALAAAAKDNVTLKYSNDPDSTKEAVLIQDAVNAKVDGIAVTIPDPPALIPAIKQAVAAGIPVVAFNAGIDQWKESGALMYFGQDETVAGQAAGARATSEGFKHVLCVLQAQGQVQLESRCNGVQQTFKGQYTKLYVNGADQPSVRTTIAAKLKQDPSIDLVITLGAPIAQLAIQAVKDAGSNAKIATFDFNTQVPAEIENGQLQWAIDQQPYVEGYEAVDSLWLYITNGDTIGGGEAVKTGPFFVDKSNVAAVAKFAERGTR
ncbi:monosaccharide ABC transporter substrate-binding protein, CUT2 family [Acidothermus cellulolyticus 11B]|uniref:Monosaccharide ABC transporter substrate-binding protein, CUT2 family n=1 Tax=Acidothermus cellulolyticus (strain ATCC 43068 / DSM 8971 / 11B) TaxID=351607 RepID=A0LVW8_ACIC1|nr:monosaccharide ABC transporter substrate-binding protein, CUT2 family [Acidothermus cellulolyticus 11B]